eukprot:1157726-Pelagomonas_calceolata.AAC.5
MLMIREPSCFFIKPNRQQPHISMYHIRTHKVSMPKENSMGSAPLKSLACFTASLHIPVQLCDPRSVDLSSFFLASVRTMNFDQAAPNQNINDAKLKMSSNCIRSEVWAQRRKG